MGNVKPQVGGFITMLVRQSFLGFRMSCGIYIVLDNGLVHILNPTRDISGLPFMYDLGCLFFINAKLLFPEFFCVPNLYGMSRVIFARSKILGEGWFYQFEEN